MLWTVVGCGHSDGYRNYKLMCGNCHMDQAEGLLSLVPPLEEAANVLNYIIRLKEFGAKPFTDVEIKTYIENCR